MPVESGVSVWGAMTVVATEFAIESWVLQSRKASVCDLLVQFARTETDQFQVWIGVYVRSQEVVRHRLMTGRANPSSHDSKWPQTPVCSFISLSVMGTACEPFDRRSSRYIKSPSW